MRWDRGFASALSVVALLTGGCGANPQGLRTVHRTTATPQTRPSTGAVRSTLASRAPTRLAASRTPGVTPAGMSTPAFVSAPASTATADRARGPEGFEPLEPVADILSGRFPRLHTGPEGRVWIVTDEALARMEDDGWSEPVVGFAGPLAGIDRSGRIWVVADQGETIMALQGLAGSGADTTDRVVYGANAGWEPIDLGGGPFPPVGWPESRGPDDVWLTTRQDVRLFDGQGWKVLDPGEMGMEETERVGLWTNLTLDVAEPGDTVWVGACDWGPPGPLGGQGIRWLEENRWRGKDSPVASGCATAFAVDDQGGVWAAVDEAIWRFDSKSRHWANWEPPAPPIADLRFGFAHALTADPSGGVWVTMVLCGASCYGQAALYRLDATGWRFAAGPVDYPGWLPPQGLATDQEGRAWLSWAGSLYGIGPGGARPVSGLGWVQGLIKDASGTLWMVADWKGESFLWTIGVEATH